jgi:Ca2+-binding EF-hand superfamily protein
MKYVLAMTALALASATSLVFAGDGAPAPRHAAFLERLKAADTNADGMLSRSEAAALPRLAKHFDAIDANRDGQVSFEELKAFHQAHRGHHGAQGKAMLGPDGKVTREEFLARAAARFDRLDANKDGLVTAEEMRAGHAKHARGAKQ